MAQLRPKFTMLFIRTHTRPICIQIFNRYYVNFMGAPVNYKDRSLLGVKWGNHRIVWQFLYLNYEYTR